MRTKHSSLKVSYGLISAAGRRVRVITKKAFMIPQLSLFDFSLNLTYKAKG